MGFVRFQPIWLRIDFRLIHDVDLYMGLYGIIQSRPKGDYRAIPEITSCSIYTWMLYIYDIYMDVIYMIYTWMLYI